MKLNALGRATMNSSARAMGQRYVAGLFERLGGIVPGGRVLEVGCGGGMGVEIILERFGAAVVHAIDIDPKMIKRARRRLARHNSARVRLSQGDVTALEGGDGAYDAVFDFGAIHIERNWPKALSEVRRVLKPGGKYYFELVTNRAFRLVYPLLSEGFATMQPPREGEFIRELERVGVAVGRNFVCPRLAAMTGYVGDLVGVGRKIGPSSGAAG
ncbi:MAG TPA: class I SAM-dependent methyltransferase [Anaerolineales bacterium]|nr:class I SAM-dependent methyltransferase [Anaerolineales bacterium]